MRKTEQEIRIHKKINKEFNKRFPNSDFILYETTVLGTYDARDGTKELKDFIDNVIDTTIQECQKEVDKEIRTERHIMASTPLNRLWNTYHNWRKRKENIV